MKTLVKIILICTFSLASDCGVPFDYVDNSRMIVDGSLRYSTGATARNQQVRLVSEGNVLTEGFSDNNGKFSITSPKTNKTTNLVFDRHRVGTVTNFPALSNTAMELNQNLSIINLGMVELKPIN